MTEELIELLEKLDAPELRNADVISWGCPIISFGNVNTAKIATLGLNPSNKEFVDNNGDELVGKNRRFHTLSSLGLNNWSEAQTKHVNLIVELCQDYFARNPYDGWFRKLDYIISGTSLSYYFPSGKACHLDLIPFATMNKWTDLSLDQKNTLLQHSGDTLGLLLKHSPIETLILNGQSVVDQLEKFAGVKLEKKLMPNWTLPRKLSDGVAGYSYYGYINQIGNVRLENSVLILGYNHNIQSSFGVTSEVQKSIRNWITIMSEEIFQ